jgi:hypothetical protein
VVEWRERGVELLKAVSQRSLRMDVERCSKFFGERFDGKFFAEQFAASVMKMMHRGVVMPDGILRSKFKVQGLKFENGKKPAGFAAGC